jgi:acyl carrier protein phosphodiesterase
MYANLQGDYIKGKNLSKHPQIVQHGIHLHRTIDHFIDTHPAVRHLLKKLYPHLPKISGIAVDLYFDHLLAKNWVQYHNQSLRDFVDSFHQFTPSFHNELHEDFSFMLSKMQEYDWLYQYQYLKGLSAASTGLSRRISFENNLYQAPHVYQQLEKEILTAFGEFMHDAETFFEKYFQSVEF